MQDTAKKQTSALIMFATQHQRDLRQIAARTGGEHSPDDVLGEAWLLAAELAQRWQHPFDWADPHHQATLLAWLHNRLVAYADKSVRRAVKLDRNWDRDPEAGPPPLAQRLAAPARSDPLQHWLWQEEQVDPQRAWAHSYSQAAAYAVLLDRVHGHLPALAHLLWVQVGTVRRRLRRVTQWLAHQGSVFDGIERIPAGFAPWRRTRGRRPGPLAAPCQGCLWPAVAEA